MFPQKLSDIFHRERYSIGSLLLPRLVNKLFDPKIFCKFVEVSKFRDDGANRFIFRFSLIFNSVYLSSIICQSSFLALYTSGVFGRFKNIVSR